MGELVSVIMPAYNAARFIGQAIESVIAQSWQDWELLVVDDCSSDCTAEVVARYQSSDPRIRSLRNKLNSGPANSRNAAMAASRGRYWAFLDSDDMWLPEKLRAQIAFMQAARCGLSYTSYRRMTEAGDRIGKLVRVPDTIDYLRLLRDTSITTSTAVVDRHMVGDVAWTVGYGHEDFVFWLSILRRGTVACGLNSDLARYRTVAGSLSRSPFRSAQWVWRIYREHEGMSIAAAATCFGQYAFRAIRKHRTL